MKVKINDKVKVITGKDKGKTGKITKLLSKQNKIVVEKVNMKTKHIKKTSTKPGEKIQFEAPMQASNAMVVCPHCDKPTRVGYKLSKDAKKQRICKKCNGLLDKIT
jgi:large subunit ribosomal protein L24